MEYPDFISGVSIDKRETFLIVKDHDSNNAIKCSSEDLIETIQEIK